MSAFLTAAADHLYRLGWAQYNAYASRLKARVAFAWPSMNAVYEAQERIVGHAADIYNP